MVRTIAVRSSLLAGYKHDTRLPVFHPSPEALVMPKYCMKVIADTSELENDLERIERGELSLPTVSAIDLLIDDIHFEEMPIYLGA
jgi:hypothetical protein